MRYGSALLFTPKEDSLDNTLQVRKLQKRYLKPTDCLGSYIENSNLHSLPPNCLGVLAAYSPSGKKAIVSDQWHLGVILFLHPTCTLIHPCKSIRKQSDSASSSSYEISPESSEVRYFRGINKVSIIYLNIIHPSMIVGDDGFIEASVLGPDVIFSYQTIPGRMLKQKYDFATRSVEEMYSILAPSCYRKFRNNPFKKLSSIRVNNKKAIKTEGIRTLLVKPRRTPIEWTGFAFPYPCGNIDNPTKLSFAFLNYTNASNIIRRKSMSLLTYVHTPNQLSMFKMTFSVYYVTQSGIAIEERSIPEYNRVTRKRKRSLLSGSSTTWNRKGFLHSLWVPCETVQIPDEKLFKSLMKKTYRDFSYSRSKSLSFGLNVYIGKKSAPYVRATPKTSKRSTTLAEYYREEFDPTFLPIVYKLLNRLSDQAQIFQSSLDPVFDKFLAECFSRDNYEIHKPPKKRLLDKIMNGSKTSEHMKNKRTDVIMKTYGSTIQPIPRAKRFFSHRRFAALSILTSGNSKTIGFSNCGHKDNDFVDTSTLVTSFEILKELRKETHMCNNKAFHAAYEHIKKRYMYNHNFSTYTTCGYKVLHNTALESNRKHLRAYFLCNSFNIAIAIPLKTSCYHTFDATSMHHQTTVPIIEDSTTVHFKDNDISILAWGNGKCAKRLWLEKFGINPTGRKFTQDEITSFFNSASDVTQNHMSEMGWI